MAYKCLQCMDGGCEACTPKEAKVSESPSLPGLSCSFCKKEQAQVRQLIAAEDTYICNECVLLCVEIIREDLKKTIDGIKALHEFAR